METPFLNKLFGVEESYDLLTSLGLLDQESPSPWIPSIPAYIYNAATFGIMTLFIWGHGVIGLHRHVRFKSRFYNNNFNHTVVPQLFNPAPEGINFSGRKNLQ